MIDRERLLKAVDAQEALEEICKVEITIRTGGAINIWTYPLSDNGLTESQRHKVLSLLTLLVGKLNVTLIGGSKWYMGNTADNSVSVTITDADKCKILGYRKETRTVKKVVEKPIEYVDVEETVQVPITDCDVKTGAATMDQIEVPA